MKAKLFFFEAVTGHKNDDEWRGASHEEGTRRKRKIGKGKDEGKKETRVTWTSVKLERSFSFSWSDLATFACFFFSHSPSSQSIRMIIFSTSNPSGWLLPSITTGRNFLSQLKVQITAPGSGITRLSTIFLTSSRGYSFHLVSKNR